MPSGRRHYRLKISDALTAHRRALEAHGGRAGVLNLSSVQSAIAQPYNGYHRGIAKKAAVLVRSVATNHGFADGNKRTSLILMHLLLAKSGYRLVPDGEASVEGSAEQMVIDIIERRLDLDGVADWFKRRIRRA